MEVLSCSSKVIFLLVLWLNGSTLRLLEMSCLEPVTVVLELKVRLPNKFHNYTTSNVLLTSTFRPPSAAFFRN